jgi:hypothetical protein
MAGRQKCWKINTATIESAEKILHKYMLCGFDSIPTRIPSYDFQASGEAGDNGSRRC